MKKIEILGTGCAKCEKLAENAKEAIKKSGGDYEIIKISKIEKIMEYGVMITPAIVIDGKVKASGQVLSPDQIAKMLS